MDVEPRAINPEPIETQVIDETVPLLGGNNEATTAANAAIRRRTVFILTTCLVTLELGIYLSAAPQTELFESNICNVYYSSRSEDPTKLSGSTHDYDCKIEPVQTELAFLSAWLDTLGVIPALFLTLPYAALADRTSRKFILMLALLGLIAGDIMVKVVVLFPNIFPLRLILVTFLFSCIGGGSGIVGALIFAILADVIPPIERANTFFLLGGISMIAQTAAYQLSGLLMLKSAWIPFLLGTPLFLIGTSALLLLPPEKRVKALEPDTTTNDDSQGKVQSVRERIIETWKSVSQLIRDNFTALVFVATWILAILPGHPFILIFISKKFDTSFSTATFLVTLRSLICALLFLVVIPFINRTLTKHTSMSALTRDLRICQASAVLLILGNLGIGLAPSLPAVAVAIILLAGGNAAFVALRCVVSHIVPPANLATVYATIGIMTNVGVLAAGPILAALFKSGMKSGLTGLPYICVGAAFVVFLVVTLIVPLPKDQIAAASDEEVGESEQALVPEV